MLGGLLFGWLGHSPWLPCSPMARRRPASAPPDWSEQGAGVSWVRAAGRGLQGWGTCLVSEFLTPASRDGVAWGWGVTWKHHVAT